MAEWVRNNPPSDLRPRCTACGTPFPVRTEYCPNCGEKMYNGNDELRGPWAIEIQEYKTKAAIETLTDEFEHICHHMLERDKDPTYYAEMAQLATAMEMGIAALKRQLEGD